MVNFLFGLSNKRKKKKIGRVVDGIFEEAFRYLFFVVKSHSKISFIKLND